MLTIFLALLIWDAVDSCPYLGSLVRVALAYTVELARKCLRGFCRRAVIVGDLSATLGMTDGQRPPVQPQAVIPSAAWQSIQIKNTLLKKGVCPDFHKNAKFHIKKLAFYFLLWYNSPCKK